MTPPPLDVAAPNSLTRLYILITAYSIYIPSVLDVLYVYFLIELRAKITAFFFISDWKRKPKSHDVTFHSSWMVRENPPSPANITGGLYTYFSSIRSSYMMVDRVLTNNNSHQQHVQQWEHSLTTRTEGIPRLLFGWPWETLGEDVLTMSRT